MGMKELNLIQNTPEWLDWRKKVIGGSDVPAIMTVSPYKTPREIYYSKVGYPSGYPAEKKSYIQSYGHDFETRARREYSKLNKQNMDPICIEHSNEIFGASLDGRSDNKEMGIEIKYVGEKVLKDIINSNIIPPHFLIQIQWQMMIAELGGVDLVAGTNDTIGIVNIKRNEELIGKIYWSALMFHEEFVAKLIPPPYQADDIQILEANEDYASMIELKEELENYKLRVKHLEDEYDSKIKKIQDISKTNNVLMGRLKLTRIERKGNVDYSKIGELKNVDLEQYRKGGSKYWKTEIII